MRPDALWAGWIEAWSGRDPAAFEPLCAAGFHYEDPFTPEPLDGPDALGAHARRLWSAFPDARMEATGPHLIEGGRSPEWTALPVKVLGTHRAALGAIPATGRFVVVHGVCFAQRRDGRFWRVRAFSDAFNAAVQVGVLPRPGSLGERALLALRGFGLRAGAGGEPSPPE